MATIHTAGRVIEGSGGGWGKFPDVFDPSFKATLLVFCEEVQSALTSVELEARHLNEWILREQASFAFTSTYTRTRATHPDDPSQYGKAEGAIDHAAERGRVTVELDLGLPELGDPITLRWDADELEAELGGDARRMARDRARRKATPPRPTRPRRTSVAGMSFLAPW